MLGRVEQRRYLTQEFGVAAAPLGQKSGARLRGGVEGLVKQPIDDLPTLTLGVGGRIVQCIPHLLSARKVAVKPCLGL